jgi:hypothetical protein
MLEIFSQPKASIDGGVTTASAGDPILDGLPLSLDADSGTTLTPVPVSSGQLPIPPDEVESKPEKNLQGTLGDTELPWIRVNRLLEQNGLPSVAFVSIASAKVAQPPQFDLVADNVSLVEVISNILSTNNRLSEVRVILCASFLILVSCHYPVGTPASAARNCSE